MKTIVLMTLWVVSLGILEAKEGSSVRGGGHVIEQSGNVELLDLVSQATCEWKSGSMLMNENTKIVEYLGKIEQLDWYLALEFKREIEYLSWCFTGGLSFLSPEDEESFVMQTSQGVLQVGIRYGDSVYLDRQKFTRLSTSSQALLVFHEMAHSYLPMGLEMRKFKLMSTVDSLRRVAFGQIRTQEQLHRQLAENDFDFPLTVNALTAYKHQLTFLLAGPDIQELELLKSEQPESFLSLDLEDRLDLLASWDRPTVINQRSVLVETLKRLFARGVLADYQKIFFQNYETLNPAMIALPYLNQVPDEHRQLVKASPYYTQIIEEGVGFLQSAQVQIQGSRLIANRPLIAMADTTLTASALPVTSLPTLGNYNGDLPLEISALAHVVIASAQIGDFADIEIKFGENSAFQQAFKMAEIFSALEDMDTPISREKELAQRVLRKVQRNMQDKFVQILSDHLSEEEKQRVLSILKM